MSSKKYLAVMAMLVMFLGLMETANAKTVTDENNDAVSKRVIAHTEEEANEAISRGCRIVRKTKNLKALRCPHIVAESLPLTEDVKVFALENEESDALGLAKVGVGIMSASANTQIGANIVHTSGNTGSGRKVVVIDSGYNYLHPELSSSYLGGKDFVNNDNDPMDDHGHGSHVAGIITADGVDPNAKGVAPDAGVLVAKVLDNNGSGYFSDVVSAIYWAVNGPDNIYGNSDDFNVDAISISLGTEAPYLYAGFCDSVLPDLTSAIQYATEKNVAVVVAAGNSGAPGVSIPGCISYSTTVGAVDNSDNIASFSSRGGAVEITAPGVSIYSSILGSAYASWSGTSMATPMITGVVALIKKAYPTYTQNQVENTIFNTAEDLGAVGKDNDYGWGRVRVDLATGTVPTDPTPVTLSGSTMANGTGTGITVTHGLSIQAGDVILAFVHVNGNQRITSNNGISTFTEVIDQAGPDTNGHAIYSRIAGSSEPLTYQWTMPTSDRWSVEIRVFKNVNTSNIWDVAPSASTRGSGNESTATAPSMNITTPGSMGITFVFSDTPSQNFINPTNGYNNELEAPGQPQATYIRTWSAAGTTGAASINLTSNDWMVYQVALRNATP